MAALSSMKRTRVFYGDPNAEKMLPKIDSFGEKLLAACFDAEHPVHKTLGPDRLAKLIVRYIDHHEFRARLDWAKEQYYEQGNGSPSLANSAVCINFGETSKVPVFE